MGKDIIIASLMGVISEVDIDLIRQYLEEIELSQRHKQACQEKLTQMCQNEFPKEFENPQTIPEINKNRSGHENVYNRIRLSVLVRSQTPE